MKKENEFLEILQLCPSASSLVILKTMEEISDKKEVISIVNSRPQSVPIFFDIKNKKWKSTKING